MTDTPDNSPPNFEGSPQLVGHYCMIGTALIVYERMVGPYGYSEAAQNTFRENVSFVPVEILDGYLEDLFDSDKTDTKLHIERSKYGSAFVYLAIIGLVAANVVGLSLASAGRSFLLSFMVTLVIALPFAFLWHMVRDSTTRRLRFAKIVSAEVSRRRGVDREGRTAIPHGLTIAPRA